MSDICNTEPVNPQELSYKPIFITSFYFLSSSLVEEFRKTLCALWQGSQTAFSPESLFYVVWKIMPNFR